MINCKIRAVVCLLYIRLVCAILTSRVKQNTQLLLHSTFSSQKNDQLLKPKDIVSEQKKYSISDILDDEEENENENEIQNILKIRSNHDAPSLVLNANYKPLTYIPLSVWSWQDALRAIIAKKASIVHEYEDRLVHSLRCTLALPSVIALKNFHHTLREIPPITKRFVLLRDEYRCQYCLKQFPHEMLSLDHVTPKARGGQLTWTNTVTACYPCNYKKGSSRLEDLPTLHMRLRKKPHQPTFMEIFRRNYEMQSRIVNEYQDHSHSEVNDENTFYDVNNRWKIHPHWKHYLTL